MTRLVEKLKNLNSNISKIRGDLNLFALFLREDSEDLWDLLVSSDWILQDKEGALKYISTKIKENLLPEEMLKLSRIVIIEKNNPALDALFNAIKVENGVVEVKDCDFFGMAIKRAYFIVVKRY